MRQHARNCWVLLLAATLLLLTCCAPWPAAAAVSTTRKNKNKNHSNFFHSLIRRLGGNNTCQPKAKKRCKPHEVWYDKAGMHQPPTPNGCGSRDLPVKLARHGNFTACCDEHDICFATCDRTKSECDEAFRECMVAHCHAAYDPPPGLATAASSTHARGKRLAMHLQRCLGEASLYYSGVYGLACGAYKRAQLRHCGCRLKAHIYPAEEELDYASDSDIDSDSEDEDLEWGEEDWSEEFDEEEREAWEREMGEMMLEDEWSDDELSDDEWSDDEGEELVTVEIE